MFISQAYEAL